VRILYFSSDPIGIPCLRHLASGLVAGVTLAGVVTGTDQKKGRGRKLQRNPVAACADEPIGGNAKVRVPWPNKVTGEYKIRDVKVSGLKNLSPIQGQHADFKLAPDVKDNHLKGSDVKVKAERKDSVIIPTDELSSEVLTIYAHLQRLRELDRRLGYGQKLQWPRNVGVRVQAKQKSGAVNRNNAFYFSGADALLLVPYTRKSVPVSLNAGILAHEHFHPHFHHLLKKDISFDFAVANPMMAHVAVH